MALAPNLGASSSSHRWNSSEPSEWESNRKRFFKLFSDWSSQRLILLKERGVAAPPFDLKCYSAEQYFLHWTVFCPMDSTFSTEHYFLLLCPLVVFFSVLVCYFNICIQSMREWCCLNCTVWHFFLHWWTVLDFVNCNGFSPQCMIFSPQCMIFSPQCTGFLHNAERRIGGGSTHNSFTFQVFQNFNFPLKLKINYWN